MLLLTALAVAKTAYDVGTLCSDNSSDEDRSKSASRLVRRTVFNTVLPFAGDVVDGVDDLIGKVFDSSEAMA